MFNSQAKNYKAWNIILKMDYQLVWERKLPVAVKEPFTS